MWRLLLIAWFAFALAGAAGCGGPTLVPVEGVITLDGKPLVGATIAMELVGGEKDLRLFAGETDASGKYAIKPFESTRIGALPGEYRIMIKSVKSPQDEMVEPPKDPVPVEFQNGTKTLTVPEGGITNADFAITTRPGVL
jgi:hypothetical protein